MELWFRGQSVPARRLRCIRHQLLGIRRRQRFIRRSGADLTATGCRYYASRVLCMGGPLIHPLRPATKPHEPNGVAMRAWCQLITLF